MTEQDWSAVAERLTERVHAAIDKSQDEWGAHPVPSPSSVFKCRRRLWYQGRGHQVTDRTRVQSIKRLDAGKQAEPFWHKALHDAGFIVMTLAGGSRIPVGDHMDGEFDGYLLDLVERKRYALELKDLGGWGFMNCVLEGVRAAEPDYWYQTQQYMGGLGIPATVFIAGCADPAATSWLWSNIKKMPGDLPPFHLEVIPFEPSAYFEALERAEEVANLLKSDVVPARDYDPLAKKNAKDKNFPCGTDDLAYCPFRKRCLEDN